MKRSGLKEALAQAGLLRWDGRNCAYYVEQREGEIELDGKRYMAKLTATDDDGSDPLFEPSTKWELTEIKDAGYLDRLYNQGPALWSK